jgi:hypothetical protein
VLDTAWGLLPPLGNGIWQRPHSNGARKVITGVKEPGHRATVSLCLFFGSIQGSTLITDPDLNVKLPSRVQCRATAKSLHRSETSTSKTRELGIKVLPCPLSTNSFVVKSEDKAKIG